MVGFLKKPSLKELNILFHNILMPEKFQYSYNRSGEPKVLAQERLGPFIDDTEINIFDAQRYFNESRDHKGKKQTSTVTVNLDKITDRCDLTTVSRFSSVSSVDGYVRNYRSGSSQATPTVSSEASWNSQSGLLSIPPGSIAVSMRDLPLDGKRRGSSIKWFFGTRCPCSGKKSVQIEEKFSNSKSPFHSNCNSNSSLNPKKQSSTTGEGALNRVPKEKAKVFNKNTIIDERKELKWESSLVSLEDHSTSEFRVGGAFSFPILNPQQSFSFPNDIDHQSFTFPASPSPITRATVTDDDVASDTSSDLFEIESFSTQTTMYPLYGHRDSFDELLSSNDGSRGFLGNGNGMLQFRRRQSLDGFMTAPSIAATECYEPSEVTTTEGIDRGSVTNFSNTTASEYENVRFIIQKESDNVVNSGGGGAVSNIRRKGKSLLGCRCEKAVSTLSLHPAVKQGPDYQHHGDGVGARTPAMPVESCQLNHVNLQQLQGRIPVACLKALLANKQVFVVHVFLSDLERLHVN